MTREEHIYQLEQYLKGHLISMCPSSSLYWKEHYKEVIELLKQDHLPEKCKDCLFKNTCRGKRC